MKMKYMRIPILAYFLTDTLNWQMLWGKEKYLLNSLYDRLENKFFFQTNANSKEPVSLKDK